MATHALINVLKAKRPAFGAWITLPGALNARAVARSSPDLSWVCVDCEHGMTSLHPGAAESVIAVVGSRADPPSTLVRIPATGSSTSTGWQIKYALDAGALGVVIPMVATAEKAKEVVADCRFPPIGRRGFGSPITHGVWGQGVPEYIVSANQQVVVLVQIETREAVDNVEEIAAVDGVDVLFIGPFDLSLSLGYQTPSPDPHPEVEKVIQKIKTAAQAAGKHVAIYCTSGEQAAKRAEEGFDMINVTSDSGAIAESISRHISIAAGSQS